MEKNRQMAVACVDLEKAYDMTCWMSVGEGKANEDSPIIICRK